MATLLALLFGLVNPGYAAEVQLVVTGSDRAIVIVDGERHVLKTDQPPQDGVRLLSADSDRAIIEVDGQRYELDTNAGISTILEEDYQPTPAGDGTVTIWPDRSGFFFADGEINGRRLRFLVDTGADNVTLSSVEADRIGLKYDHGRDGMATTASGVARMKRIKLNTVSLESITLYNVPASVILGRFPDVPLLGASFINQLSMSRTETKMELRKRGN